MINFLVGLGASIGVIIIYSLLKVASDFDDEVDEMYKEYDYFNNNRRKVNIIKKGI